MTEEDDKTEDAAPEENISLTCDNCGMTFERFKERYRVGCAECYEAFRPSMKPLLRKIHGTWEHSGERHVEQAPAEDAKQDPAWTLELMQRRLKSAIEREEFEEAARLRDEIESLKQDMAKE